MKVLILIDAENFTRSISRASHERKQDRYIDWHKISGFVLEYLSKNPQYKNVDLFHTRTYYYNGEVTDSLLSKVKKFGNKEDIKKAKKIKQTNAKIHALLDRNYFVEKRLKPLQYEKDKGLYQKGIDVQMAVDLVAFAYKDTYDIVVIFSGDVDLLDSIQNIKNLGKQVIVFSSEGIASQGIQAISDMYVDFSKLDDKLLNLFSHEFAKK